MPDLFEVLLLIYDHLDLKDYEKAMVYIWEQVQKETIDREQDVRTVVRSLELGELQRN